MDQPERQHTEYSETPSHSQSPVPAPSNSGLKDVPVRGPTKASRRIRGEIACAECRRLKIRCDRTVPCSTCVKRGCGALCPNGTIPPGEGSRFVLAATDHLRHKLTRMEARMHSLEDALAIIHGSESDRVHPLLSVKEPNEETEEDASQLRPISEETAHSHVPLREALGTLWLDKEGGARFFGPSGGSESLLQSSNVESTESTTSRPVMQELDPSYLSPEINQCYQSFPFTPPNVSPISVQTTVESFLPSIERAIQLCDTFLEHLSWMFHIVSRHKLVNELIPIIYKQNPVEYGPHDLALLLIVLGIGSLVDLNLPPFNLEAQHYYRLAKATVATQSVLGSQSVVTVKVLHLMSIYNGMSGKESNLEQSYAFLDLAGQVALRIGFHIDPSMWGFKGREAYDRRVYFWNLISGVQWQSLVTGRPPSLLITYIDCQIPTAEEQDLYQEGEVPLGFGIWGFKASAGCLVPLVRLALAAKPPSYESVMELDRKIRDLALPASDFSRNQTDRTATSMQLFVRSHYQELMLLFLHRAYFAQAMMEHGDNPLKSPYSQSVTAAYSSACVVLQDTIDQFLKKPLLCARIWRIWSFTFSAAVVVGTIAIRGAHLDLQPPALDEFEAICRLFTRAAKISSRADRALPVLQAMLRKAREANAYYQQLGKPAPTESQNVEDILYVGGNDKVIQHRSADPTPSQPSSHPRALCTPRSAHHQQQNSSFLSAPLELALSSSLPVSRVTQDPLAYRQLPSDLSNFPPRLSHAHYNNSRHVHHVNHNINPDHNNDYKQAHDPARHASSSCPPPPVIIPPISHLHIAPPRPPPPQQQQETFADLSHGWSGLFHEVPSHSYAGLQHRGGCPAPDFDVRHVYAPHPEALAGHAGASPFFDGAPQAGGSDQVMLDDRWVAFMNYDVMGSEGIRERGPYQQP